MKKQLKLISPVLFIALANLTSYGQQVGDLFTVGSLEYKITSATNVEVVDYTATGGAVTIPPTVDHGSNTYTVTAIGEAAFEGKGLTSVTIPNTVTSIRSRAFHNNQLTSVTIPNRMTVIGHAAFYSNQLTSVIIPGSVTSIGAQAFQYNKLTEVTISDGVTTIGGGAFRDNLLQGRLEIPNSVTSIGHRVFYNNDLAEVTIGENVTSIGDDAFRDNNLTRVTIPNSVTSIGKDAFQQNELAEVTFSTPSRLTRLEEGVFKANNLTGVSIPDGVSSIGNSAFSSNQLIEVIIPGSVTDIGPWAFSDPNLNLVTVQATVPPRIQDNTFSNRSQIDVVVPRGSGRIKDAYENENAWGTGFRSITEEVGDGDFFTVGNLRYQVSSVDSHEVFVAGRASGSTDTGITIPRVVSVAAQDFKVIGTNGGSFRANNLTRVTFESPSNVTRIDGDTFRDNNLTSVTIPNSVTSIRNNAFMSNQLTSVIIPGSVTSIGAQAFQYNKLTEVTISDGVTTIGGGAFRDNLLQGRLEIPNSVTSIGDWAFYNNDLAEVTIGENVTSIGDDAFRDNNLTRVTIPNSVTSIGKDAFQQNELAEVTFSTPSRLTRLEEGVFKANNLTGVSIPDGVSSIGNSAFSSNQLIEVIIPGSVTDIGPWAFSNPNLNLVTVQATVPPRIQDNTFSNRHQIDVFVPKNKIQAYETAGWTGFKSITEINYTFSANDITYRVTSLAPYEVETEGYAITGGAVTIPQTVDHGPNTYAITAIGSESFLNKQLTKVTIPNSVTSIGASAFADNKLTSVTIPESVTSIGDSAFMDNDINSVVIPITVTSIGIAAFWNNRIASLEIPGGIADIGENTFGRNNLASVTIPASVASIGSNAFLTHPDEPGITQVTVLGNTPPTLAGSAFSNRNQIDVVVPKGKRQAYLDNGWTGFKSITEEGQVITAVSNDELNDLTLYPNPARDKVYIDPGPGQALKQVNIYTMTGAYLYSENGLEINTGRLSGGMYLFEIVTKTGERSIQKVIIE